MYLFTIRLFWRWDSYQHFLLILHEQEQEYIIKDALNKILYFNQFKTIYICHVLMHLFETHTVDTILEPLDYRNILDYLEYHSGTNQETVRWILYIF